MSDLFLCTKVVRRSNEGDDIDVPVIVFFHVSRERHDEYEFTVDRIEFDSGYIRPNCPPDDADWPLSDAEDATIRQWFDANYDQACTVADEGCPDRDRIGEETRERFAKLRADRLGQEQWKDAAQ